MRTRGCAGTVKYMDQIKRQALTFLDEVIDENVRAKLKKWVVLLPFFSGLLLVLGFEVASLGLMVSAFAAPTIALYAAMNRAEQQTQAAAAREQERDLDRAGPSRPGLVALQAADADGSKTLGIGVVLSAVALCLLTVPVWLIASSAGSLLGAILRSFVV